MRCPEKNYRPLAKAVSAIGCAVMLLIVAGCGGEPRGAVAGKVTLDGQPVDGGTIAFVPQGTRQRDSGWGQIQAGQYAIGAAKGPAAGVNRVEIRWTRGTGRKVSNPSPMMGSGEEVREAVPNRYNRDSELTREVKPGNNQFDFELRSQ